MKLIISLLLIFSFSQSFAISFTCPASIEVEGKLLNDDDGFDLFPTTTKIKLTTIQLTSGHPKELAILKPDPDYGKGKDYWLMCYFGDFHTIKKMEGDFANCKLIKRKKGRSRYSGVECTPSS